MIAWLEGTIAEIGLDHVVLDVQGVGYRLAIANGELQESAGQKTRLYVHEHIREDAFDLYGFSNLQSKELFEQLLSVKNVGPKVTLAILSMGSADAIRSAIAAGDVRYLQAAKGVGKRAAEQIVVELRDKVGLPSGEMAEQVVGRSGVRHDDEAFQALLSLGYTEADAHSALAKIDTTLPSEERIRQVLRGVK